MYIVYPGHCPNTLDPCWRESAFQDTVGKSNIRHPKLQTREATRAAEGQPSLTSSGG